MSDELLKGVIKCYGLTNTIININKLSGGITNLVYKIDFVSKSYIIKILTSCKIGEIETSEHISYFASKSGVKSLTAIKNNGKYIQNINGYNILLYDFYDGKILLTKELNIKHIKILAKQLANLHNINCKKSSIKKYEKNNYDILYNEIKNRDELCFQFFKDNISLLNKIYNKVYMSYMLLSNQTTYIHRDFNRKNILWKSINNFKIIDWETATIGNPIIDFFNSAWFLTNDFQKEKFIAFKNTYFKYKNIKDDFEIGAYASIIEECNWLYFSLKRALGINIKNEEEIKIGKQTIESSLIEIINFYNSILTMINYIN